MRWHLSAKNANLSVRTKSAISMKKAILSVTLLLCAFSWAGNLHAQMNNRKLEKALNEAVKEIAGEEGAWHFYYRDRVLFVLTDEDNNRMRIFTPIIEEKEIDAQQMHKMLVANFHSALDAKYSIYEGFVISTYTHPLKELTEGQLLDALSQVINLADTFGTTYSSTELYFGGHSEEKDRSEEPKPIQGKKS